MSTNVDLKSRKLSLLETVSRQINKKMGLAKEPVPEVVKVKTPDENKN